jgi:hypothetical protein
MTPFCPEKRIVGWTGFFLCLFLSAGCKESPVKPANISANDVCYHCRAPIANPAFAAELVTKDGFVRKFDDLACLIANARKIGKKNIKTFFVIDAQSKNWLVAEAAYFVRSEKFRTPQNGGIVAYGDIAQAQALASRYQAQLARFDELLK